jgi:hypothetical protein
MVYSIMNLRELMIHGLTPFDFLFDFQFTLGSQL